MFLISKFKLIDTETTHKKWSERICVDVASIEHNPINFVIFLSILTSKCNKSVDLISYAQWKLHDANSVESFFRVIGNNEIK